jgi:hypothetical protein
MFRGLLAGAVLALTASTALSLPAMAGGVSSITSDNVMSACSDLTQGCSYDFVTWVSAPAAYGTTANPSVGGGLCDPGIESCPGLSTSNTYDTGNLAAYPAVTGPEAIELDIPANLFPGNDGQLTLSLLVADNTTESFTGADPVNHPSTGNYYSLALSGSSLGADPRSLGETQSVTLNGALASNGNFSINVLAGETYYLGLTDLVETGDPASAWQADIVSIDFSLSPTPEPASFMVLGFAILALCAACRCRLPQIARGFVRGR